MMEIIAKRRIPKLSKGGVEGVSSQRCQLSPLTDHHSLLTPRKAHANEYHTEQGCYCVQL